MLWINGDIRSFDRPLEARPEIFDGVGMNAAPLEKIFLMVDGVVFEALSQPRNHVVDSVSVSEDGSLGLDILGHDG